MQKQREIGDKFFLFLNFPCLFIHTINIHSPHI